MSYKISFRDPSGTVLCSEQRVYRIINPEYTQHVIGFVASKFYRSLLDKNRIVKSWKVDNSTNIFDSVGKYGVACCEVLEHEKLWFVSYPYEWPFEMLHAAAKLTLEIAFDATRHNYILKDASPYNVLFEFCNPVFVDICSFEKWDFSSPIWKAQAQFERTFLGPLIANSYQNVPIKASFYENLNGPSLEYLYKLFGVKCFLSSFLFFTIFLPYWLGKRMLGKHLDGGKDSRENESRNRFVSEFLTKRLMKITESLKPPGISSYLWSTYDIENSYSAEEERCKEEAIKEFLCGHPNLDVLDVGCNSGRYSILAAREGCRVVSIDRDPSVVGRLWSCATREKLPILPLVIDFAEPSPAMGWDNSEYASFVDRSIKKFDAVFVLALVHHLQITNRIPLEKIFEIFSRITRRWLIIEYISAFDPMFKGLANGRDALFKNYSIKVFESAFSEYFVVEKIVEIKAGMRSLFFLRVV